MRRFARDPVIHPASWQYDEVYPNDNDPESNIKRQQQDQQKNNDYSLEWLMSNRQFLCSQLDGWGMTRMPPIPRQIKPPQVVHKLTTATTGSNANEKTLAPVETELVVEWTFDDQKQPQSYSNSKPVTEQRELDTEKPANTTGVYVYPLSEDTTVDLLHEVFSEMGKLRLCRIQEKDNERVGVLIFSNSLDAQTTVQQFHKKVYIDGVKIDCAMSR